jgi:protein-tyrosine phosphatase
MSTLDTISNKVADKSLTEIIRKSPRFVQKQLIRRSRRLYYYQKLHATPAKRSARRATATDRLTGDDTLLFVCHGNICRSPFAEWYARQELDNRGIEGVTVDSTGFQSPSDPTSPQDAVTMARNWDVDLTSHRSVQTDVESLEMADLVLLMDYKNYHDMTTTFPEFTDRIFFLRLFDHAEEMELTDPYKNGTDAFETVYEQITHCIDAMLDEYLFP